MSENNIFLKVRDLAVEYTSDGKVIHAVNGVSFSIDRGKTLALVGETGAGKTTIAKSILGILPDRAARIRKGQIYLDGPDLVKDPRPKDLHGVSGPDDRPEPHYEGGKPDRGDDPHP